jgi:hypothetical protein
MRSGSRPSVEDAGKGLPWESGRAGRQIFLLYDPSERVEFLAHSPKERASS